MDARYLTDSGMARAAEGGLATKRMQEYYGAFARGAGMLGLLSSLLDLIHELDRVALSMACFKDDLAPQSRQLAGGGSWDDPPGRVDDAVLESPHVLEHERALATVERPAEALDRAELPLPSGR